MTFPDQPGRSASILEWAIWCAEVGRITSAFKIFQCWPGEKLPLRRGWQQLATNDRLTIESWWTNDPRANIGLAIQPGHVVIDGDLYKPGKEAALDAYEARHGELPRTLEFRSARGGVHLIYQTERNLGNSSGTLPDFGDVRGHGGLIVGPGSWFEDLRYGVDNLATPVLVPAHVEARLVARKHRTPDERRELPEFVSLDDPQNVERFVAWLKKDAQTWGDGSGHGNNTLAATGAMGSSYALSWEVTLECMVEHWNPRVTPPWDDEPLEKHGGSGYRSASSSFGNMAARDPRLMFPAVLAAGEQPYAGWGAPVVNLTDLLARGPAPARQWALGTDNDGWMPLNDLTLLYGPGGAGKTTLVGQMARCFADGVKLFGNIPVRQMKVLYVGCEDDIDELHRRFGAQGAIEGGHHVNLVSLIGHDTALHPPFKFGSIPEDAPDTPFYQFLEHHLASMGETDKVLFLDNLGQMYFGDYQDRGQIAIFQNRYVRRLLMKHRATGCILAHPSTSQVQSGDGGAGSPAWSANVRSHLYFDWVRDKNNGESGRPIGDTRVFSRKKSNYSRVHQPGDGVFLTRDANWTFSIAERPKPPETPTAKRKREAAAEEGSTRFVVKQCLDAFLEGMGNTLFSTRALASGLAAYMVGQGSAISASAVRKHLDEIQPGYPHYHINQGWQRKIVNNVH